MPHQSIRAVGVLSEEGGRQQFIDVHVVVGEVGNVLVVEAEQLPIAQMVAQALRSVHESFLLSHVLVHLHRHLLHDDQIMSRT